MAKENIERLITEFKELNSKYTMTEIIESIINDDKLTNESKVKFISIKLQMDKANKEIIKLLKAELKK
jgi:hypothetical protein